MNERLRQPAGLNCYTDLGFYLKWLGGKLEFISTSIQL